MKLWYCSISFHSTVVRAANAKVAEEMARRRAAEYGWDEEPAKVRELSSQGLAQILVEIVE